ncbi:MAG TPA: aldehyde dehydrogenase family protein, partial [Chthoniobacterales bacterium]|nr:aldehyde dehydrogenase family protein [Chthoniobacterales bacterium]
MAIASINPATGERLREFEPLDEAALEEKLATAEKAFQTHRLSPFSTRVAVLETAADILDQELDSCARTISLEM